MSYKEGDWNCSNCGDHQFARNSACRKCGTPKDGDGGSRQPALYSPRGRDDGPPSRGGGFKDGDWNCAECGDHQFARNATCRKCGAPRPVEDEVEVPSPRGRYMPPSSRGPPPRALEARGDFKDGDWNCAECGDHQFARNSTCRKCGAPRPDPADEFAEPRRGRGGGSRYSEPEPMPIADGGKGGGKGDFKGGDWSCAECGDHQFARNTSCRKCGAPKPVVSSNHQFSKAGDWICPNPDCGDLQFERNQACRRCGTSKPGAGGGGYRGGAAYDKVPPPSYDRGASYDRVPPPSFESPSYDRAPSYDYSGTVSRYSSPAPAPRESSQSYKAGDWNCPQCGDHQFERNQACRKCGCPKPEEAAPERDYAPRQSYSRGPPPAAESGGKGFKPGDWACPSCGDHQFGRNETCRRCGTGKPMVSSNRQSMKQGDWICPNQACGDLQFARNDACRKCGTPKPDDPDRSRSPRRY